MEGACILKNFSGSRASFHIFTYFVYASPVNDQSRHCAGHALSHHQLIVKLVIGDILILCMGSMYQLGNNVSLVKHYYRILKQK